jgi:type IV secretory pathway TrbF-like protein
MSLRRWQLVALTVGVGAAGLLPALALSSTASTRSTTTIGLVVGTRTTPLSAGQLESTVYNLTGSKLKSATIVVTVNGKTRAVGKASAYKAFIIRAYQAGATNRIRSVLPDVESYNADNVGTPGDVDRDPATRGYAGMTMAILRRRYDTALQTRGASVVRATSTSYCVQATVKRETTHKNGPAAQFELGRCPA